MILMIQNIVPPILLSVSSISVGGVLLLKELRATSQHGKLNNSSSHLQLGQDRKNAISGLSSDEQQQQQQRSKLTKQDLNDRMLLFKPDTRPRGEYTIASYDSDGPKRIDPVRGNNENDDPQRSRERGNNNNAAANNNNNSQ